MLKPQLFQFTFLCFLLSGIMACKEQRIGNQQFVKNHFVGKWPLKRFVQITTKNGTEVSNDTTFYGLDSPAVVLPVDTLIFTADGKCFRNDQQMNFEIDGTGDNINYSITGFGNWKIQSLRIKSIILTQEKAESIGNDKFIYFREELLAK